MAILMVLVTTAILFYSGTGFEPGIQDAITAGNLGSIQGDLILTIFVSIIIFYGLKNMSSVAD